MEEESGELNSSSGEKPLTFADFADDACAHYMLMGISYHEYWHGNYAQLAVVRKAYEMQQERANYQAWLQGAYVYDALCMVSPVLNAFAKTGAKPVPYHKTPYGQKAPIDPETARANFLAKWKSNKAKWQAANNI